MKASIAKSEAAPRRWACLLLLAMVTAASGLAGDAPATPAGELRIATTGLRNAQGQLAVLLFEQPEGFPADHRRALRRLTIPLRDETGNARPEAALVATFADLPAGTYAASVLHDENANLHLDTNLLGIPREGVGTVNNPPMRFGPPAFADAKFVFDGTALTLSIAIKYF